MSADWSVRAPGWQDEPMRTDLHDWLREHGIDPYQTRYVETDVIDLPMVRAELYEYDDRGRIRATPDGDPVIRTVEVALRRPPPVWSWP